MALCVYCGRDAGIVGWFHLACKKQHDEALEQLRQETRAIVAARSPSGSDIARLKHVAQTGYLKPGEYEQCVAEGWHEAFEEALERGTFDRREAELKAAVRSLAVATEYLERFEVRKRVDMTKVLNAINCGAPLPVTRQPFASPLNIPRSEAVVWCFEHVGFLEECTHRKHVAAPRLSIALTRGVRLSTPLGTGFSTAHERLQRRDAGTLAFTALAMYFAGAHVAHRFPYQSILSFLPGPNGLGIIQNSANSRLRVFEVPDGAFAYQLAVGLAARC